VPLPFTSRTAPSAVLGQLRELKNQLLHDAPIGPTAEPCMHVDVVAHHPQPVADAHDAQLDALHGPVDGQLLVTQSHRPVHVPFDGPVDVPSMHRDDDSHHPHPDSPVHELQLELLQFRVVGTSSVAVPPVGPKVAVQAPSERNVRAEKRMERTRITSDWVGLSADGCASYTKSESARSSLRGRPSTPCVRALPTAGRWNAWARLRGCAGRTPDSWVRHASVSPPLSSRSASTR
jgi:hypothetical protein